MKGLSKKEVRDEIDKHRNHAMVKEIYLRHKDDLDREVLDYFGNMITYEKIFRESGDVARALKAKGLKKGDELVVCIDRIPEYVYLWLGASILGLKINFISEKFNESHLEKIIRNANANVVIVQDQSVKLDKLLPIIDRVGGKDIVTVSHKRSLNDNNLYQEVLEKFYDTNSSEFKDMCLDYDSFIELGKAYKGEILEESCLDDAFTVTYSSATTRKGMPEGIVHSNRHYITMGRYHDSEVSGLPAMKDLRTYSNIPAYSNSYLSSSLSDNLVEGGMVILDPIDNPEYFLIGAKVHKGNMNIATTSTWLVGALNYYMGDKYNIKSLPDALFNFAAGEQLSAGEEKFLNKFFRDVKCGVNLTHTPISITKISTAGSDCEHGSLFMRIFRAYFNKLPYRIGRKEPIGMSTYNFVDVKVLRDDGTYCLPLEHGRVVANSDCNMVGYNHNPEETKSFYIKDAYGNVYGDMNVFGFLDEKNNLTMKGRYVKNLDNIPCYRIADAIMEDTKKIMSCEVVNVDNNGQTVYVAHIMPQYGVSFDAEKVLNGALQRCINKFGIDIKDILYFRIRDYKEMYPITSSCKRDYSELINEGLNRCHNLGNVNEDFKGKVKKLSTK